MLEIGSLVDGKYKILNKVGQGGMSVVYLAMNEKANKQWAVKEVRKDGIKDFEVVKQGLVAETDILKKLSHPNLPSIVDVIDTEDSFIIIMDYIQGNSLNKALDEYGAQPQDHVIAWAKQLCDVLGYLHTRTPPIVYRDMKPSNVMLSPDGKKVTLIYFGTAREYKSQNIADTTCLGTIGYAAPEQFGGQGQTDARTDIYCLGATLYHLVTGQNPCEPPYEIKPIREWNPALSEGLEKIIMKCTQKNPDDRYQSCSELRYDLDHYEELDAKTRKKQAGKLKIFISMLVASVVFLLGGFVSLTVKDSQTEDVFIEYMHLAENAYTSNERIEHYISAIELLPDRIDPYLGLISAMIEDDVLSAEEVSIIRGYNSNIKELSEQEGYTDLVYNIVKMYWSCYEPLESENVNQNIINAKEWLDIISQYKDFDHIKTVEVMKSIADYTESIQRAISQLEDQKDEEDTLALFVDLKNMLDYVRQDTSNVLRLKTYDLIRYIISQEITYFKRAGITLEEVNAVYDTLREDLLTIDNPNLEESKNSIIEKLDATRQTIEAAYANTRN